MHYIIKIIYKNFCIKNLTFIVFLFFSINLIGQPHLKDNILPDSISSLLLKNSNDNDQFNNLTKVIDYLILTGNKSNLNFYLEQLIALEKNNNNLYNQALINYYKGVLYSDHSPSIAIPYLFESLRQIYLLPDKNQYKELEVRIYLTLSYIYINMEMYSKSYESVKKGLDLNQIISNIDYEIKLKINLAVIYRKAGLNSECIKLNNALLSKIKENNTSYDIYKSYLLNNIGNYYLYINESDSAIKYFTSALNYIKSPSLYSATLINIGASYLENNNIEKAKSFFYKALSLATDSIVYDNGLPLFLNLAQVNFMEQYYDSTIYYTDKILIIAKNNNSLDIEKNALLLKSKAYEKLNNYKLCVETIQQYNIILDSINKIKNIENIKKSIFQEEIATKELEFQETIKAESYRSKKEKITLFIIIFLLVIIVLIILHIHKLSIEKKDILLKNKKIQEETLSYKLDIKNRELTSKTLMQVRVNEVLNDAIKTLSKLSSKENIDYRDLQNVITSIKQSMNTNSYKEFEYVFVKVHPDFFKKLLADFPNLTQNEQRICAFIKLNMSTKDIASVLNISPEGVRSAKSRLRTKFNLSSDNNSLSYFLSNY